MRWGLASSYAGVETITADDFDFLCKLDLDLRMPVRYFETLAERMNADRSIATCSGKACVEGGDELVFERHGDENFIGAAKIYRVTCFPAIGGFVREVGWDGIDGHMCRMHGWSAITWDEPELRFIHLRPRGTGHKGIYIGRIRQGFGQCYMGTSLLYLTGIVISRLNQKPYVLGQLATLWGWIGAALRGEPRYDNLEFRKFLRRYQLHALLVGKKRAVQECGKTRGSA